MTAEVRPIRQLVSSAHFVLDAARDCRCCQDCSECPCGGCLAGGICDDMVCLCDDEPEDEEDGCG